MLRLIRALALGFVLLVTATTVAGPSVRTLIDRLEHGSDFRIRMGAALELGKRRDRVAREPLERALGDENPAARAAAAALALLGDVRAVPALQKHLQDQSRAVRDQVEAAIAKLQKAESGSDQLAAGATSVLVLIGDVSAHKTAGGSKAVKRALLEEFRRASRQNLGKLPGVRVLAEGEDGSDGSRPAGHGDLSAPAGRDEAGRGHRVLGQGRVRGTPHAGAGDCGAGLRLCQGQGSGIGGARREAAGRAEAGDVLSGRRWRAPCGARRKPSAQRCGRGARPGPCRPASCSYPSPIVPPFRDERQAPGARRGAAPDARPPVVMSTPGTPPLGPPVTGRRWRPVYARAGGFAPALRDNARAALWLLLRSRADSWHFVFAPNPRTSAAARWLRRLRRMPVHPDHRLPAAQLRARWIGCCSATWWRAERWTAERLRAAGAGLPIEVIPPPVGGDRRAITRRDAGPAPRARDRRGRSRLRCTRATSEHAGGRCRSGGHAIGPVAPRAAGRGVRVRVPAQDAGRPTSRARRSCPSRSRARSLLQPTPRIDRRCSPAPPPILFPVDDLLGQGGPADRATRGHVARGTGDGVRPGPLRELEGTLRLAPQEPAALVRAAIDAGARPGAVRPHGPRERDVVARRLPPPAWSPRSTSGSTPGCCRHCPAAAGAELAAQIATPVRGWHNCATGPW